MKKAVFLILALFGLFSAVRAQSYDFSAVAPTGQTLYYKIDGANVSVTSPEHCCWDGFTQPTGSLAIPDSVIWDGFAYQVTTIGYFAFYGCYGLTSVTLPSSITSIESFVFLDCNSLTNIEVDSYNPYFSSVDGVLFNKQITCLLQYPCGKAGTYSIPNSVTSIGEDAFVGCNGLTLVDIPNSVTYIMDEAFLNCSSLISVSIPNTVIYIGMRAFMECSSLTSIDVDSDNPNYSSLDGVLFNKEQTTLLQYPCGITGAYTIPNSVTSIGDQSFFSCSGLTSVTIPNTVVTIKWSAFNHCSALTSVTIPNSVDSIELFAFADCTSLDTVICLNPQPAALGLCVFDETPFGKTLIVPCGAGEAYRNSEWGAYFTHIAEDCDPGASIPATSADALRLYPNPSTTSVTIEGYEGEVQVIDLQGRVVKTQLITHHSPLITLEALPQGTYFVKLGNAVQKLIIQ